MRRDQGAPPPPPLRRPCGALPPPSIALDRLPACLSALTRLACLRTHVQEFDTACALVKGLLQRLLGQGAPILAKRIDDGGVEGEPCAGEATGLEGREGGEVEGWGA